MDSFYCNKKNNNIFLCFIEVKKNFSLFLISRTSNTSKCIYNYEKKPTNVSTIPMVKSFCSQVRGEWRTRLTNRSVQLLQYC